MPWTPKNQADVIKYVASSINMLKGTADDMRQITSGNATHRVGNIIAITDAVRGYLESVLKWLEQNESINSTKETDNIS
jgi:hypothetical protein